MITNLSQVGIDKIDDVQLTKLKEAAKNIRDAARLQVCARSALLILQRNKPEEIKGLELECSNLKVSLPSQLKKKLEELKKDWEG